MTRAERLRALRLAHDDWAERNAEDAGQRFFPQAHPRPGSDYNLHNIDIGASGEAQDEWAATAAEILGLPAAS